MQKRIVRKLDLELLLSKVASHPSPSARLEQYMTPVDVAATVLYVAAYVNSDVVGKSVLDLGCGTGRLALGAAFLGAKDVVGVDVDKVAVDVAVRNAEETGLGGRVRWMVSDVEAVRGSFDTVLMNPPFGVQKRAADRAFLEKALEVGRAIYSLHKRPNADKIFVKRLKTSQTGFESVSASPFLKNFVEAHGGEVRAVYAMAMAIPRMFDFHTERRHEFVVDLYVIQALRDRESSERET